MLPRSLVLFLAISIWPAGLVRAQQAGKPQGTVVSGAAPPGVQSTPPADYVIGVDDLIDVVFLRDKEMSAEVVVRPDGKISVPMLNDIQAAGLTPEQLAAAVTTAATKFIRDPAATIIVKEIRSRKVFVIGEVTKPGSFSLASDMTVMQALAEAGGFAENAKRSNVTVVRVENGKERRFNFNYNDVIRGRHVDQNIKLRPGDTILVRE